MAQHHRDTRDLPDYTTRLPTRPYTPEQVMRKLAVTASTLLRMLARGDFGPPEQVILRTPGGHRRYRRGPIDAFAQRERDDQAQRPNLL